MRNCIALKRRRHYQTFHGLETAREQENVDWVLYNIKDDSSHFFPTNCVISKTNEPQNFFPQGRRSIANSVHAPQFAFISAPMYCRLIARARCALIAVLSVTIVQNWPFAFASSLARDEPKPTVTYESPSRLERPLPDASLLDDVHYTDVGRPTRVENGRRSPLPVRCSSHLNWVGATGWLALDWQVTGSVRFRRKSRYKSWWTLAVPTVAEIWIMRGAITE